MQVLRMEQMKGKQIMRQLTPKHQAEIKDLKEEFNFTQEQAQEVFLYMLDDELDIEEAIQSYYYSRGLEVPTNLGVSQISPEKKKRATPSEIANKREQKRKAQEVKQQRDAFKAQAEQHIIDSFQGQGHVIEKEGKKTYLLDEHGYKYELKVVAKRV